MKKPDCFIKYFQPVFANSNALKSQVHQIRYEVYCTELEFENGCPTNVEKDEFDAYSFHYLLQHKASNKFAGTMRMVLPPSGRPELLTPLEKYCLNAVNPSIIDITKLPRGSFAEVSRLAVPKLFRRRSGDFCNPKGSHDKFHVFGRKGNIVIKVPERRQSPNIATGLYLIAASLFVLKRLDYIFIMIDPKLAHSLTRVGLHFEQMGDAIEYHGLRAPFFITPEILNKYLSPELRPLQNQIMEQVSYDLLSCGQYTSVAI